MNNRHYLCGTYGSMKRSAALVWKQDKAAPDEWPRCCDAPMTVLDYEEAAAIIKLRAAERLQWLALGRHIFRGRQPRKWKAALTSSQVDRAIEAREAYIRRIS